MELRNKLVSIFGLKTEMSRNLNTNFVGDKVGIFEIYDILDDEIIAGENDKHLDFRVSIFRKADTNSTRINMTRSLLYISNHLIKWMSVRVIFARKLYRKLF